MRSGGGAIIKIIVYYYLAGDDFSRWAKPERQAREEIKLIESTAGGSVEARLSK
jgi:hypothetical protein